MRTVTPKGQAGGGVWAVSRRGKQVEREARPPSAACGHIYEASVSIQEVGAGHEGGEHNPTCFYYAAEDTTNPQNVSRDQFCLYHQQLEGQGEKGKYIMCIAGFVKSCPKHTSLKHTLRTE